MKNPPEYEICFQGVLSAGWSDWFAGLAIRSEHGDVTVLTGPLPDQAALHGVLARIRDLGLELISVNRVEPLS